MFEVPHVRRHANGAIHIEHYARIGRRFRALAVRDAARRLSRHCRARAILHAVLLLLVK